MKKIALLHDFLVDRGLVTESQLEVWTDDINVHMPVIHPNHPKLGQTYSTQVNILIKDFTDQQDIRAITLALGWWLNVHETQQANVPVRMKVVPYIENRRISEVWLGLAVSETVLLGKNGAIDSCIAESWGDEFDDLSAVRIVLVNEVTGESHVINEGVGGV